tara:strand:+ start:356 stop:784 length:429 start_codon:yes stop_codon:yes gene_type:complete
MATEILVNDGGAPARIMNLGNANAAIEAGMFVDINSSGKIIANTEDQEASSSGQKVSLGVLLVDAVAGAPTSIITGKGLVCNVQAAEALSTVGTEVTVDNAGKVEATADADAHRAVGITLAASFTGSDSGGNDTTFVKVLLI